MKLSEKPLSNIYIYIPYTTVDVECIQPYTVQTWSAWDLPNYILIRHEHNSFQLILSQKPMQ